MIKLSIVTLFLVALIAVLPAIAQEPDYCLQSEDVLQITVYEQPDLDTRARISSTGEISFPLLGKIMAAGLTVSGLRGKIERLLARDYLVSPQVQVFIEKYRLTQVSVLGSVQKPGKYDMYTERETTVLEAIAMAGGFTKVANINSTRIIRTENGQERIIPVKVSDITKKGMKEKDIPLKPGDIVFVPESFF
ncbi:MAG: polysaccharide biosynthesis/export family protein [Candidatus Omnitrophota bacterium]|nr:polysaccharide biosynthesis/export family protein [Candidatus Omnitrophota bacterium]